MRDSDEERGGGEGGGGGEWRIEKGLGSSGF